MFLTTAELAGNMDQRVAYLDNNASTALCDEALKAMVPFLRGACGNPSSPHRMGESASFGIERARDQAARALGRKPNEIFFTSGGTESANLAIRGALAGRGSCEVVTTGGEHACVLATLMSLTPRVKTIVVPLRGDGNLDHERVIAAVGPRTALVCVMHVNNETGAIFPVDQIADGARKRQPGVLFFSDGVQAFGKIAAPRNVDLYSISGHKLHGPKGVGALLVRNGVKLTPQITGGGQERGLRSGTENVPGIVGLGAAAAVAAATAVQTKKLWAALRGRLAAGLHAFGALPNSPKNSLPSTLNTSIPGVAAGDAVRLLNEHGVCASAGSACSTGKGSHVLKAMGLPCWRCSTAIRFSMSRYTTADDIDQALAALRKIVPFVRASGKNPCAAK